MGRRGLLLWVGWALYLAAFPMVAVDTDFGGELVRGFDVRGYQCFLGAFVATLGGLVLLPVWIVVDAANLTALLTPLSLVTGRWSRVARWTLPLGAVAAWMFWPVGRPLGVARVHAGYFVWAGALTLLAVAVRTASEPRRRA